MWRFGRKGLHSVRFRLQMEQRRLNRYPRTRTSVEKGKKWPSGEESRVEIGPINYEMVTLRGSSSAGSHFFG